MAFLKMKKTANQALLIALLGCVLISSSKTLVQAQCPFQCMCSPTKETDKPKGTIVVCKGLRLKEAPNAELLPADTVMLDLSANRITTLKKGFLDGKRNIRQIMLQGNRITVVEDEAFSGLKKLSRVDLSKNMISNLTGNIFSESTSLKFLDLSMNNIRFLEPALFSELRSLRRLILSDNGISVLADKIFAPLRSLTRLELDGNPIICDCRLKWLIKLKSSASSKLTIIGRCNFPDSKKGDQLNSLRKRDLPTCSKNGAIELPVFRLEPNGDQLSFTGDNFLLTCEASWSPDTEGLWFFENKPILEDKEGEKLFKVNHQRGIIKSTYHINNLAVQDSGKYECRIVTSGGRASKTLYLLVVEPKSSICHSEKQDTNKGIFHWHNTVSNGVAQLPCALTPKRSNKKQVAKRQCGVNGVWKPADLSQCLYISKHTRELFELRQRSTNSSNKNSIAAQLELLTRKSYEYTDVQDIIFVTDIVDSLARNVDDTSKFGPNLVRIVSNIMNAKATLLVQGQNSSLTCKRLIESLEYFTYQTLIKKKKHMNLPSALLDLEASMVNPTGFSGQSCTEYVQGKNIFNGGKSLQCSVWINMTNIYPDKDIEATLSVPQNLFSKAGLKEDQILDNFIFQVMVFRNSKLFPNIIPTQSTSHRRRKREVTTSVVSVRLAESESATQKIGGVIITNLSSPIVVTFKNQRVSEVPLAAYWDFTALDGRGAWVHNKDVCNIIYSTANVTRLNCYQLMSRNYFAVLGVVDLEPVTIYTVNLDYINYVGAGLCTILLLCTLITYMFFKELRYGRDDAAMLMNCCLAVTFFSLSFVIGINRVDHTLLCRSVGVLLHYFALCSLLWFGCGGICVYRLVRTTIVPVEYNPVLRYYLVSWGVPLIICGITLAGDVHNYTVEKYCGLLPSAFLGGLVGPACLFVLIDCFIFMRLRHLIIDVYDKGIINFTPDDDEDSENANEPVLRTDLLEHHNILQKLPPKEHLQLYIQGSFWTLFMLCLYFSLCVMFLQPYSSSLLHIILTYCCGIANILVGLVMFIFYCLKRVDVRECWRSAFGCKGAVYKLDGRQLSPQTETTPNGDITPLQSAPPEDIALLQLPLKPVTTGRSPERHSDHHSNISLPSSAALTLDRYGLPLHRTHIKPGQRPASMIEAAEPHLILDKQSTISAPPEVNLHDKILQPKLTDRRGPAIIGSNYRMSSSSTLSRINSSRDILNKNSSVGSAARLPSEKALSDKSSIKTASDIGHTSLAINPSEPSTANSIGFNSTKLDSPNIAASASSYSAQGPVPSVPYDHTPHPTPGVPHLYPIPEKHGPMPMTDAPPGQWPDRQFPEERPPAIGSSSPYPMQQHPMPLQPLAIHPGYAYPGQNNPRFLYMHPVDYERQGIPPGSPHLMTPDQLQMGPPSPKHPDRQQAAASPIPGYPINQSPHPGYCPDHHPGYAMDRHPHHHRYYPQYAQAFYPHDARGGYPVKSKSQGSQTPSAKYPTNQHHNQPCHFHPGRGTQLQSTPHAHPERPPSDQSGGQGQPHSPGPVSTQGSMSSSYPVEAPSPEQTSIASSPRHSQEAGDLLNIRCGGSDAIPEESPGHSPVDNTFKRPQKEPGDHNESPERTKNLIGKGKRARQDAKDWDNERDKVAKMPYVPVPHLRKRQLETHSETSV